MQTAISNFRHLEFMSRDLFLSPCYSASLCQMSLKSDNQLLVMAKKAIFAARCYASAAYVVMRCPSVRVFVCHVRGFYQNE